LRVEILPVVAPIVVIVPLVALQTPDVVVPVIFADVLFTVAILPVVAPIVVIVPLVALHTPKVDVPDMFAVVIFAVPIVAVPDMV
jgi:hypothetical protein